MKASIKRVTICCMIWVLFCGLFGNGDSRADEGNIDNTDKYAWSENAGWLNFRPTNGGVTVHGTYLSGYAWAENIGWIKLGSGTGPYDNSSSTNWGVNRNSGTGALSGYAWSEIAGWINFDSTSGQVTIDPGTGRFDGYAWAENAGWIHFKYDGPQYNVKVADAAVTSFSPTAGGTGTHVTLVGTDFIGVTDVQFGGVSASGFTVNSHTEIVAQTAAGSVTGKVSVITPAGTAQSANDFTVNSVTPNTYYVNIQSGSDSLDGLSSLHAWKTLHHAMDQINGGSAGSAGSGYTLNVLLGADYSTDNGEANRKLAASQDYVTITGETGSKPTISGPSSGDWDDCVEITGSHVTLRNLNITGFTGGNRTGIDIIAGSNNTIEDSRIYGNHDGISVWQSDNCTIQRCQIDNNEVDGISFSESTNGIITQNTVNDNYEADNSDGIIVQACNPEISGNTVYDNRFNISLQASAGEVTSPTIKNNLIYQVTSGEVHFGILMGGSGTVNPEIYHNTIDGGLYDGIYMDGNGNAPKIKYNIITGFGQFGIFNYESVGNPIIDYNDVWDNASGSYDGCFDPPPGENNISADPQYASYTLAATSPCINAIAIGNPPDDPVTVDIDGTARPYGSGFDMGAYENTSLPAVSTIDVSAITSTSASSSGNVDSEGASTVTDRGICWSSSANPTTADNKISAGPSAVSYTLTITGLNPGTSYHVRAYAINTEGTAYGKDIPFTTVEALPTITSFMPTSGTQGTAVTIHGTNFTGATAVTFGGTAASGFTVNSSALITALVGNGSTGKVTVTTPGGTADGPGDFTFTTGSTAITGLVTNAGGQPVEGVSVCAWPFTGTATSSWCANTLPDGTYTIGALPGYARVRAEGAGYLTEYYDNSYDPNWATAVWVTAGQTTPNINFSMGHYGSISGMVAEGNRGMSTPLANICVDAYRHPCATDPLASARTDINGSYTIENLPPQIYHVKTRSACTHPLHYDDVWWNSTGGKTYCDQAGPVTVTSGQNTGGIDFTPIPSEATYPGPSFRSAGVFSAHHANESITTAFYAFIDGPGPEDVASFTATGPSGTFHLSLNGTPFIQLGNFYSTGSASVVADGTYTFVVTDSLGRTATVERIFTYDGTIPQVDSATMKVEGMGNQAYVGTATPTLTWEAVDATGLYYQVFVYDYDGRAIWYSETTDGTSITIPPGSLHPDTAYRWWVRVCDIPMEGERGQNRHFSDTLYFFTGTKGLPDLSTRSLLSYHSPDNGWANWFGISQTNLAPWDIDRYHVTGPNGTVYPYNGRLYLAWHPMFYYAWSPGPAPTPDGTYTYDLEDTDLNKDTRTTPFTYNPATPVSEATRSPAPNAYLYTKTPTFSWSPPDRRETYYYNLRIYDYKRRIHWYSYSTTETSVTLPHTLDGPPGSYKWEVRAYSDPEHMNGAFSSARTFTVPPIAPYDYTLPGGTGQITDYRIFTVPYYMGTGADFLKALEKGLGPYDNTRWRIYGVDYPDNVEITSADFSSWNIIPGMGFWIISLNATPIQVEGTPCPQNNDYKLLLPSNWSLMALPWSSTDIDLGNIQVTDGVNTYSITSAANNLTQRCVWQYTGTGPHNGYEKLDLGTDTLQCGTGYFLKVLAGTEVTVIFPPQNNRRSGRGERGSTGHEEEPPPPPGGAPPYVCPDISDGRLEGEEFPRNADCPYGFHGTLTLGNGVTIKEGASVTFKAE